MRIFTNKMLNTIFLIFWILTIMIKDGASSYKTNKSDLKKEMENVIQPEFIFRKQTLKLPEHNIYIKDIIPPLAEALHNNSNTPNDTIISTTNNHHKEVENIKYKKEKNNYSIDIGKNINILTKSLNSQQKGDYVRSQGSHLLSNVNNKKFFLNETDNKNIEKTAVMDITPGNYTNTSSLNNEQGLLSNLQNRIYTLMSTVAAKINEYLIINPNLNSQNTQKEIDSYSILITYSGIISIIIIFIFLWKKVFSPKNAKESLSNENAFDNIQSTKNISKGSVKNKGNIKNKTNEIAIPVGDNINLHSNRNNNDESLIMLKGRTKRIPRTINYNELFVSAGAENPTKNFQKTKLSNNLDTNLIFTINFDKGNNMPSNIEDFFDTINQNKKLLEILNPETQILNPYPIIRQNDNKNAEKANNFVQTGTDLWRDEKFLKAENLKNYLPISRDYRNDTQNLNERQNFIDPVLNNCVNKLSFSNPISHELNDSKNSLLNDLQTNKSFSDTKERLKTSHSISKTPLSKLLKKQANNH